MTKRHDEDSATPLGCLGGFIAGEIMFYVVCFALAGLVILVIALCRWIGLM